MPKTDNLFALCDILHIDPPTSCAPIHKPDAPAGVSTSGAFVKAALFPFRERAVSYYNSNNSFSVFLHLPPALARPVSICTQPVRRLGWAASFG